MQNLRVFYEVPYLQFIYRNPTEVGLRNASAYGCSHSCHATSFDWSVTCSARFSEQIHKRSSYLLDMPRASTVVHVQPPTTTLSLLCEGLPHEERRQALNGHYSAIEKLYDDTVAGIGKAKATIEEARVKYENMNDMVRTLEQLRCSLEQHIRTVRLNEGSFAGTSSVLEYDAAKSRTNNLISVIKARSQWELAKEHLKEEGRDDQQKIYECLADMQSSQETLFKFVSNGFDIREFEDMKDRYLAWQSAALIFAIQQADFEKLTDIQKIYETLGRKNEFVSIFRRVSMNRLREFSADGPSVQFVIDALYKELEFVFTHHHRVLRRFLDDDAASALLSEAIQEGLKEINLTEPFSNLISVAENPIELLQKTSKFLATRSDSSSKVVYLANISQQLKCEIVHDLMIPFRSALLSYILSRINTLDLVGYRLFSGNYTGRPNGHYTVTRRVILGSLRNRRRIALYMLSAHPLIKVSD
ncbi:hypothetical protein Y032_0005g2299 [Ancylostoma ceylanicum]|uniref:Uncharacterized protein n=1 Tax=Ancylostoma ceylanicum TaxID=53326 RepID=A0A016VS21_9BILA|nr:hypothetical protein Y032_0005g2299 [Ancylostoma ceylanicum]